jgi:lipopolysaccharide assembly outer membrane protein LptD (OstA)
VKPSHAIETNANIICSNDSKSNVIEFSFKNNNNHFYDYAFKKIKNKFIEIGSIVGQKPNSFILFEDKYAFLGVDFAWHLDKNTMRLKPILLSEGTIELKKLPEELSCINKK